MDSPVMLEYIGSHLVNLRNSALSRATHALNKMALRKLILRRSGLDRACTSMNAKSPNNGRAE